MCTTFLRGLERYHALLAGGGREATEGKSLGALCDCTIAGAGKLWPLAADCVQKYVVALNLLQYAPFF